MITNDRTCPSCRKKVDGTDKLESLGDLRGWDRAGVIFINCPNCSVLIRIQEEDVCRGQYGWQNYYITIADETDEDPSGE